MFICSGPFKTPICLRNSGPLADVMDWLMAGCRALQQQHLALYLQFQSGEYIPLDSDDRLQMAVEMTVRYYASTLDPNENPQWMDEMDDAWQEMEEQNSESEEESDSQSDEYDMDY
jgi:hypothetical protein